MTNQFPKFPPAKPSAIQNESRAISNIDNTNALDQPFVKEKVIEVFKNIKESKPDIGSAFAISIYGRGGFKHIKGE